MKIALTGGGSSGHVSPLLAVAAELVDSKTSSNHDLVFLGTSDGIEKEIIMRAGYAFYDIAAGKIRRYFDWKNFTDPFKVPYGTMQAMQILRRFKPQVIFSSGGYVSVPVIMAARTLRIPVILYEPNTRSGLANRMLITHAKKVCLGFPDMDGAFPHGKAIITGHPIRPTIRSGSAAQGYALTGFTPDKPVVLFMGGSQGAQYINELVHMMGRHFAKFCQIVHICGPGHTTQDVRIPSGYKQFEYVHDELPHIYAITSLAISRAGANSLAELAANHIPSILIPLPTAANGHQLANAQVFEKRGAAIIIEQESLHEMRFVEQVQALLADTDKRATMGTQAGTLYNPVAAKQISDVLRNFAKRQG